MDYLSKIQKIVSGTKYTKGWRYRHAKNFDQALNIYVEFIITQLQNLNSISLSVVAADKSLDITPDLQDRLLITIQHFIQSLNQTLELIVKEFAELLESYQIVIPINEEGYLALKKVLKQHEKEIVTEINNLHLKVLNFKRMAKHTQLSLNASYKKLLPILNESLKFDLKTLDLMFKTGDIPKLFNLINLE